MRDESTGIDYWSEGNLLYMGSWVDVHSPSERTVLGVLVENGDDGSRILEISRSKNHWHRKMECWLVNAFIVENCKKFRLAGFYLKAVHGSKFTTGYVLVQDLLGRPSYSMGGYEPQVQLRPEDLIPAHHAKPQMVNFVAGDYSPLPTGQTELELDQEEANRKVNENVDAINEAREGGKPVDPKLLYGDS